jgi:hypothetical protein
VSGVADYCLRLDLYPAAIRYPFTIAALIPSTHGPHEQTHGAKPALALLTPASVLTSGAPGRSSRQRPADATQSRRRMAAAQIGAPDRMAARHARLDHGALSTVQPNKTRGRIMGAYDAFRTMLNIRQRRKRPRAGARPAAGAKIAMEGFKITVLPGLSDELWEFLVHAGFREMTFRPDRRRYRSVSSSRVAELYKASHEHWRGLLVTALKEASNRPLVRAGTR